MSLHGGLDTVSISTFGVFSKTYGSTNLKLRCNLFASLGFLEDAPIVGVKIINIVIRYIRMRRL